MQNYINNSEPMTYAYYHSGKKRYCAFCCNYPVCRRKERGKTLYKKRWMQILKNINVQYADMYITQPLAIMTRV